MIEITENITYKLPGMTSLFVKFPYNAEIVAAIKTLPLYNYDKKSYTWEVPVTSLAKLLERVAPFDQIKLSLLPDKPITKIDESIPLKPTKTKPFKHQEEAVRYGLANPKFLLLDAPGLGKSKSIIDLANELKDRENLQHCLIICGVNTLKFNWKKEIEIHSDLTAHILGERYTKKGKLRIGSVNDRVADLQAPIDEFFIITNIETLRNKNIIKAFTKGPNKIDMIVVDEIHKAGGTGTQQGKGLLSLTAPHMIGATGTLLTNSPMNAYLPLTWLGVERGILTKFKYYYYTYAGEFNDVLLGYRHLDVLQAQISSCSLRRTKDLLDLPEKTIINEIIEMEPAQAKFYDDIKNGIVEEADKVDLNPAMLLSMVTRLRQATSCPAILSSSDIESSKINRACDLVEEIIDNGEKVVVFSAFKPTLDVLMQKLQQYNPVLCTGDVKDEIISKNVDEFQTNPNCKVILATVQKLGTGVTLTAATNAVFIDAAWTAAQNEQAEDRIHRISAKKPVFIYYLWNADTIDLRVKEIVENKKVLSDFVVDGTCPPHLATKLREIVQDLKNS